jgi:hypothetical protein
MINVSVTEYSAGYVTAVANTDNQGIAKGDFFVFAFTYAYSGSVPTSGTYTLSGESTTSASLYFYTSPTLFNPSKPLSNLLYSDTYSGGNKSHDNFIGQVTYGTAATTLTMSMNTSYWNSQGIFGPPTQAQYPLVVTLNNPTQGSDFGAPYSSTFLPLPDSTTLNTYFTTTQNLSALKPTGSLVWDFGSNEPVVDGIVYWTWDQGGPTPQFVPEPAGMVMGTIAMAIGGAFFALSRLRRRRLASS